MRAARDAYDEMSEARAAERAAARRRAKLEDHHPKDWSANMGLAWYRIPNPTTEVETILSANVERLIRASRMAEWVADGPAW
jgi:hypothetical protein